MLNHCKEHGLNCPHNFINNNKKLVLNNKTGKPFGASAITAKDNTIIMKILKPEIKYQLGVQSFNNIRNMLGLGNNNLKGASSPVQQQENNICEKTRTNEY
ncbi:MAG TPA: hypothetical protein VJ697_02870 [Nitrososphaeraceae archaeon]|nr:hypothetical protein [Nitrososphaeraceae archaeon]